MARTIKFLKKRISNVGLAVVIILLAGPLPVVAIEPSDVLPQVLATEGAKEALNAALKVARTKPALSMAAGITCMACVPLAGATASPGLCIACGILIAKTVG